MQGIEIIVSRDGTTVIKYEGFQGEACFKEAQRLYAELAKYGIKVKVEKVERTQNVYTGTEQRVKT